MSEVIVRRKVAAPAAKVFAVLSDFGGLESWNKGIESCQVEGEGVGAVRTLGMAGGLALQERLEALDEGSLSYSYAIVGDPPLPFREYLATVTVEADGEEACLVDWRGRFEPTGDETVAAKIVAGVYTGGLAALGKHLGADVEELD